MGGFENARRGFAILVLALRVGGAGAARRMWMEPRRVKAMERGKMTILFSVDGDGEMPEPEPPEVWI